MSQKYLIAIGFALFSMLGATFYLVPVKSTVSKLEELLNEGKIAEAYQLLNEDEDLKLSSFDYNLSKFKIQTKDENVKLVEIFSTLNLIGDAVDTVTVSKLKNNYLQGLVKKISSSSTTEISYALGKLKTLKSDSWYNSFLFEELKKIALKEQTVAAWNNCIFLCPKVSDVEKFKSERRKIYLDTSLIRKSGILTDSVVKWNPCYIPILTKMDRVYNKAFSFEDLFNPKYSKDNYLSGRYIVGDFNSTDANGNCRGSFDIFANNSTLDEFQNFISEIKSSKIEENDSAAVHKWYKQLSKEKKNEHYTAFWMWRNYYNKVEKFRTAPLTRDPVIEIGGAEYCIGQRLCLCEVQNDTIKMVAQFVTSSRNVALYHGPLQDYDCQPRYYAPKCVITSRCWDNRLRYDSLDIRRDLIMGGGGSHVVRYEGKVDLPNFMNMAPHKDYPGTEVFSNGIHEFAVGGKMPGYYMGTPISLGCVRLHSYPSRFVRWWTPNNARFFITYQYKNYIQKYKGSRSVKAGELSAKSNTEKNMKH